MSLLDRLYQPSLALLTDLYELTMACGYWKLVRAEREAVLAVYARKNPFDDCYAIGAGLEDAIAFLNRLRFDEEDIAYLATLVGSDDRPLFDRGFLDYLRGAEFSCDVDAI